MVISAEDLRRLSAQTLAEAGVDPSDAELIAGILVDADVRGHGSHGVSLLPLYLARIRAGGIRLDGVPETTAVGPVVQVEAHGGPGQVAAMQAAKACAEVTREYGIGVATISGGNHVGMLAAYRQPFQVSKCIGLVFNVSGPSVAPPGGASAVLGNNACCLIVPREEEAPFIVDFATGAVACGKIRQAAMRAELIPEGWLLDPDGVPTRDPRGLDAGGSVPVFGGYKGLCVTLIVEVLGGLLASGRASPDVRRQRQSPAEVMQCGQMFVGFYPPAFGVGDAGPTIDRLADAIRSSYPDTAPETWFPEQLEGRAMRRHRYEGIDLPDALVSEIGWSLDAVGSP
jgi:LDH2 family malate/lactate/ureidoglycolate dehydrogenase